ncbi:uncharacterized protein RAG0_05627 [Rhynchosporium agropyri]|uniref:Uncharacterized protein n=2 Tax=Rhynchosporium TaxID=38037 RepID=A0A1E1KE21_9HELO|nr:uncharacterized protein RAG0_05627 [Rhynchosporium agropyri]CZT11303.1 uncharacterized protein RCO7_09970 [Rhynchosporium commune]
MQFHAAVPLALSMLLTSTYAAPFFWPVVHVDAVHDYVSHIKAGAKGVSTAGGIVDAVAKGLGAGKAGGIVQTVADGLKAGGKAAARSEPVGDDE